MADKDFVVKNGIVVETNTAAIGSTLRVTSTGNVGISSSLSNPLAKLHVVSAGDGVISTVANGVWAFIANTNANNFSGIWFDAAGQPQLALRDARAGLATLNTNNSNFGIGVANPVNKLDVNGVVNAVSGFYGTVLTATQGTINHNSLANYVADQHVAHSGVSVTAGNGLTGGGTIDASRTLNVGAGTGITVGVDTVSVNPAGVDHNSLLNYVADQHVAHSGVSVIAGAGLTGGGAINSSVTLNIGAGTGIAVDADAIRVTNVPNALTINNGGAGSASGTTFNGSSAATISYNSIGAPSVTGTNASGNWNINSVGFTSTSQNSQFNSIGVGTAAPGTAGYIRATGDIVGFYVSSDKKLKTNITPITDALNIVKAINGVEFDWVDEYLEDIGGEDELVRKHDVGVIAQEVEKVFPQIVATRKNGNKAVKYDRIVALLIEAIKDLNKEVETLKAKIGE